MEKRLDIDIEQIIDDLKAATHEIKRLEDSGNVIGAVQLRLTQIEQKVHLKNFKTKSKT